jgi:hypothetical protein
MQLPLDSWSGIAGILRCLLWAGAKDYITTNAAVIDEAHSLMGPGWWFAVDLNFTLADEGPKLGEWWTTLGDLIPPENQEHIRAIRQSQTPKPTIYQYASRWLENLDQPPIASIPSNAWKDIAEVWYWSTRLVPQQSIIDWIADETLAEVTEIIPLPDLADLSLALHLGRPKRHHHWQEQHLAILKRRLADEYDILALEEIGTTLKIHFIPLREVPTNTKNRLHVSTMTRINLVRRLLPTYEKYASQGYGFNIAGVEFPQGDATRKDGIPVTSLPPLWSTKLNGIASGLVRNRYRPATWQAYLETIIKIRKLIVECLQQLNHGLIKFCQRSKPLNVGLKYINLDDWQRCQDMLNNICELPILAVDLWGFAAESSDAAFLQTVAKQGFVPNAIALQRYRACLEAQRQYLSSMRNFFSQVPSVWIVNANTGKLHPNDPHKTMILSELEKQGVKFQPHLSIVNLFEAKANLPDYQREFSALFNQNLDIGMITSLTTCEKDVIEETWDRWYFYAQEPWKPAANPQKQVRQWMTFAKRQLKSQIMQAVQHIQSSSCEPVFLEFEQDWQGQSALWVRFNLSNLVEFYDKLFVEFPTALKQIIGPIAPGSLTDYLRQEICTYLVVIPVIQGQLLNNLVWPFYLSTVLQAENLGDKPWSYLPLELPVSIRNALNLTIWDVPEIALANQLSTSVATLRQLTFQVGEFQTIPDPTEFGEKRLKTYIEENASSEMSQALQTFIDAASALLNRFNALPTAVQQEREKLVEAVQALVEVYKQINPGERDDGFELTVEELTDYSNRLQQAYPLVEGIRLFWIADILEQKTVY